MFGDGKQGNTLQFARTEKASLLLGQFERTLCQFPRGFAVALFGFERSAENGFVENVIRRIDFAEPLFGLDVIFGIGISHGADQGGTALLLACAGLVGFFEVMVDNG